MTTTEISPSAPPDGTTTERVKGGGNLGRYILVRLLLIIPTVFILVTMVFILMRLIGDPITASLGGRLSPDQLEELDRGNVNFEVTLFGSGTTADQPFMNAGLIVEIDPDEFGDGWVRIKVPRESLSFYTEEDYERTEVTSVDHQDLLVQGLRINPETSSGNEVRVYLGDAFDPLAKDELFKEMGIAFHTIEIERARAE